MTIIYVALAFLAGIVSFASPCCLPTVPAYVSYIVGTTPADSPKARRVAFQQSLMFVLGFTIVFVSRPDRAPHRKVGHRGRHRQGPCPQLLMITNPVVKLSSALPNIGI